jgi:GT2 family glycosyltransferase
MNNPKIGIVTVLYRSETVLPGFFDSLAKQTFKNFVLYVIDNKSPDGSLSLSCELAEKYSFQTIIVANDDNYGVAKGNNIGICKALQDDCDLILLSNNDVELSENTIEALFQGLEKQKADMAVPKIYYWGTNLLWFAGGGYCWYNGCSQHFGSMQEDMGEYDTSKSVLYAPTCFMLIRKKVFDNVGLMDEKYFVYWDDTDFVYRAIHKNNTLWYCPQSIVYHKEGTSTGKQSDFSVYYLCRNFVYFTFKNRPFLLALYYVGFNLLVRFLKRIFSMNFHRWKLALKAYWEGIIICIKLYW